MNTAEKLEPDVPQVKLDKPIWSIIEIMEYFGVGRTTAYKLTRSRGFPKTSGGLKGRWNAERVKEF